MLTGESMFASPSFAINVAHYQPRPGRSVASRCSGSMSSQYVSNAVAPAQARRFSGDKKSPASSGAPSA